MQEVNCSAGQGTERNGHGVIQLRFGGAFGGPILPDKLFFYAAYEGLRQRLDGTQIGLVPALLPIVQAYPGGTSPTSSPNVWNYRALGRQVDNEDSGMVRLDYHYSDRTTAFVRFNSDEAVETTPTGQLIAKTLWETKFNNGVFELLHVFSPRLVKRIQVWNRPGFLSQRDGIASAVYLQRFRFQLFVGKDPFRQSFEDQKLPGRHLMVEG
jgi:hypothetical protein